MTDNDIRSSLTPVASSSAADRDGNKQSKSLLISSKKSMQDRRKMSQIHQFILGRLPNGVAKKQFLNEIIDYETPLTERVDNAANTVCNFSPITSIDFDAQFANFWCFPDEHNCTVSTLVFTTESMLLIFNSTSTLEWALIYPSFIRLEFNWNICKICDRSTFLILIFLFV